MYALLLVLSLFCDFSFVRASSSPTVTIKNGTVQGLYSSEWNQHLFLGIPYAQPPLGDLRFRWPQTIDEKWNETLDATRYGYSCYQYGTTFNMSEDCLTLNVVRPVGYENETLPVLVWIYGGGLSHGSTADPQYNLSGIVKTSTTTDHPFIAVSMNYRLHIWGFLSTPLILAEGSANAGLLDQRLALRWVQENIAAFGGDPSRVTVWGESAGAQSIGLHIHSYDGRDDRLFHSAILESGGPVGASLNALPYYDAAVRNLTRSVDCPTTWTSAAQLACLRNLTSAQLFATQYNWVFNPIVDGDFLTDYPSNLGRQGKFINIPLITGANTNEGASFFTPGVNTTAEIATSLFWWRNYELSPPTIKTLLSLYPDNPSIEPPYSDHTNTTFPHYGRQWRRSAAIGGDIVMVAQRRKMCEQFTNFSQQNVYSYRFDTPLWNATFPIVIRHFDNVVFSFQNISGALGPLPEYQGYKELSLGIGRAYANFVGTHDPNGLSKGGDRTKGVLVEWPKWDGETPQNIVLNANGTFLESDTWRKEGIEFINSVSRELLA